MAKRYSMGGETIERTRPKKTRQGHGKHSKYVMHLSRNSTVKDQEGRVSKWLV